MFAGFPSDVVADVLATVILAILGGGAVWVRKQLKGVNQMTKDWSGEPARPGIADGTPGVMQRLYTQDQQFQEVMAHLGRQDAMMQLIQHEVTYNSGSSIKDAVHRTDEAVAALQEDVNAIKTKLEVPDA